jgi:hypothetical protein
MIERDSIQMLKENKKDKEGDEQKGILMRLSTAVLL